MSGQKCVFFSCELSSRQDPTMRKFSFPIKDPVRCRQWILNSGNVALANLSPENLQKKFICSKHFSSEYLTSHRLPPNAVPLKYSDGAETIDRDSNQSIKEDFPTFIPSKMKTYPPAAKVRVDCSCSSISNSQSRSSGKNDFSTAKSGVIELGHLPSVDEFEMCRKYNSLENENKKLKEQLKNVRKKLNNVTTQLQKAKMRIKKIQLSRIIQTDINLLPKFSRTIVNMQLKSKKRKLWTYDEKETALAIFQKGPATYKFLLRKGMTLPSVSTIKKWTSDDCTVPEEMDITVKEEALVFDDWDQEIYGTSEVKVEEIDIIEHFIDASY